MPRSDAEVDDLAATQLVSFARLALFRIADLEAAGFEVVPTFRTPHVTIAFSGDVVARLRQLAAEQLELRPNPYHEADPPLRPNEEDR